MSAPPEVPRVPDSGADLPPAQAIWDTSRPELVALLWESRRRIASPWALLAVAIARSLLTIPHAVGYRSALHPEGSPVNLALALVGTSGAGKSTAARGAALAVSWEGEDVPESVMTRSGEGIPSLLGFMHTPKGDDAEPELQWRRWDRAVWVHYDEVGQLAAQGSRSGSTVLDSIKSLSSGERLGGQNSRGDGLSIPGGSYRAVLTVGVQPRRADALLDDASVAGGLTARFLWFAAEDLHAAAASRPSLATDPVRVPLSHWDGVRHVDALPEMDAAHEADTRAAHRGEREAADSRRLLNRAIVSIALANMAGRAVLISADWHLAGAVLRHSDEVLAGVRDDLAAPEDDRRGDLEAKTVARLDAMRAEGTTFIEARRRLSNAQGKALTAMLADGRYTAWPST